MSVRSTASPKAADSQPQTRTGSAGDGADTKQLERPRGILLIDGTRIFDMAHIRIVDMRLIDQLFEMEGGYVLNFSDKTMGEFFAYELNIDIDDPVYKKNGTSKAKRLRCFLQTVDASEAVRVLRALWDYRKVMREALSTEEKIR